MSVPQFWLIAGPNGAGKSTLAKSTAFANLPVPKPLNPDDITFGLLRGLGYQGFCDAPAEVQRECSIQAANWVYSEVEKTLRSGGTIGVETVLSTDKYFSLFEQVAGAGGDAHLIYIGNQDPQISIERVAIRVAQSGHDVPPEKIRARWHRSLKFMPLFWNLATRAWLFDHSASETPPRLIAHKKQDNGGCDSFFLDGRHNVLIASFIKTTIKTTVPPSSKPLEAS